MGKDWNLSGPDERILLNNGIEMPVFGLGTYRSGIGRQTREAVIAAMKMGYRMVDTATIYGNERDVGRGIRESGVDRDDIFVSTKLWNADQGYDKTKKALVQSLEMLDMDQVDLYLMHWPVRGLRLESWRAMEELYRDGMARSIGVSNFTIFHLDELIKHSDIVPAVNQVEFSPFLYQKDLQEYCEARGIQLQAYSPLTKGEKIFHETLRYIGNNHKKTSAQVLIRWGLQKNAVMIPKSTRPDRIRENMEVFDFSLTEDDMDRLDELDEGLRTGWDPTNEL